MTTTQSEENKVNEQGQANQQPKQAEDTDKDRLDKDAKKSADQAEVPKVEGPGELDLLQEKYDELNDKHLRLFSDFENFRRRTAKERLDLMQQAGADIIKELLPLLDDLDRAMENSETQDAKALIEGFKLIHHKFKRTLEQQGLKEMEAKEKPFDTDLHEAVTNIPAPNKKLVGKNIDVIEKGYFLNDKVLRFAKVVVGQ